MLPAVYKQLITGEIDQILREINDKGLSWAERSGSIKRNTSISNDTGLLGSQDKLKRPSASSLESVEASGLVRKGSISDTGGDFDDFLPRKGSIFLLLYFNVVKCLFL